MTEDKINRLLKKEVAEAETIYDVDYALLSMLLRLSFVQQENREANE